MTKYSLVMTLSLQRHVEWLELEALSLLGLQIHAPMHFKVTAEWSPRRELVLELRALPAIWDHTVLPATRHKWMCLALTPASMLVLDLPTAEAWKAELTCSYPVVHSPGVEFTYRE